MSTAIKFKPSGRIRDLVSPAEWDVRVQLAACYRLMDHFGMTDLIYNHITMRAPGPERHFLINSYGMLYSEVTASSLQKIDLDGNIVLDAETGYGINPAGYIIHSAVHAAREDAHCVIHTHTRATMAVSAMGEGLLPISQDAMLFYGNTSYHDFEGAALNPEERARLVADLGDNNVMLLHNHGSLTCGKDVPTAFSTAYHLESACRIQVDAMASRKLVMPPEAVSASLAAIIRKPGFELDKLEWQAMLRLLDKKDPSYAD